MATLTSGNDILDEISGTTALDVDADAGNDSIFGTALNDRILGSEGNDTLLGGSGNDTIFGNDGTDASGDDDDQLFGGKGDDSVAGDGGNDIIFGGAGVVDALDGDDTLRGGTGNDSILGNAGDDSISGNNGNDTIYGGVGNNTIHGGNDQTGAGDGDDLIYGGTGLDQVYGGAGNDTIYGGGGSTAPSDSHDTLRGGDGNDIIFGNGGGDDIDGGAGDDTIYGGVGANTLTGGTGNDSFFFYHLESENTASVITDFDASTDSIGITSSSIGDFTALTIGSDSSGNATITIGGATITLTGVSSSDLDSSNFGFNAPGTTPVAGGSDTSSGGDDTSSGGGGGGGGGGGSASVTRSFTVTAGETLTGGSGDDFFNGTAANIQATDDVRGGAGDDTIRISGGGTVDFTGVLLSQIEDVRVNDTNATTITLSTHDLDTRGGTAGDTFNIALSELSSSDIINGNGGTDTLNITGGGTLDFTTALINVDVENITLAAASTITGNSDNFDITGSAGNDQITFAAANLTSADTIDGNGGTDTLILSDAGGSIDVSNVTDVDEIQLFNGANTITGANGTVTLTGGTANDLINIAGSELDGDVTIDGNGGTDTVNITGTGATADLGNVGDIDNITVATGGNTVVGGSNNFDMTGSSGNEEFQFTAANLTSADTIDGNGGTDTLEVTTTGVAINTTNVSDVDNLNLADGAANTVTVGTNNFNITGGDNDDTFIYAAGDLTSADTIDGGAHAGSDTISVTGGGAIDLTNVTNVEALDLTAMAAGIDLTLGTADFAVAGTGFDDTITFDDANFSAADSIDGNVGDDTLVINDADNSGFTLDATNLDGTNTREIENVTVNGTGTINVTLVDAFVSTATGTNVDLSLGNAAATFNLDTDGLSGANTVDLSGAASASITLTGTNNVNITTEDGFASNITVADTSNDEVTGGTGLDTIIARDGTDLTAADSLDGGTNGTDILTVQDTDDDGTTITGAVFDGDGTDGGVADYETINFALGGSGNANTYNATFTDAYVMGTAGNVLTVDLTGVDLDSLTTTGVTGAVVLGDSNDDTVTATFADGVNHQGVSLTAGDVANFTLGDGDHTLSGGTGDDTFSVQDDELDGSDSLTGGSEATEDTLVITGANGNVDFGVATNVSGFEVLEITADRITGTDNITLTDAFVSSATNDDLFIRTSGAGTVFDLDTAAVNSARDVIIDTGDAVELADNAGNRVVINAGVDVDVTGGTGDDTINSTDAGLTTDDTIDGGAGDDDVLDITGAAVTLTGGDQTNVDGIEVIDLDAGGAHVINIQDNTVTDATADAGGGALNGQQVVSVNGNSSTISLDASNVTSAGNYVEVGFTGDTVTASAAATNLFTATGDNNITLNAANDTIYSGNGLLDGNDTITAGASTGDALIFADGTTLDTSTISTNVTGFEQMFFAATGNAITLDGAFVDDTNGLNMGVVTDTHTLTLDVTGLSTSIAGGDNELVTITDDAGGAVDLTLSGAGTNIVKLEDAAEDFTITGGAGTDDVIVMDAITNLDASDVLTGAGGNDAIALTAGGLTVDMNTFANAFDSAGIEQVVFTNTAAVTSIDNSVEDATFTIISAGEITSLDTAGNTVTVLTLDADGVTLAGGADTNDVRIADLATTVAGGAAILDLTGYAGGKVTDGADDDSITGGDGADTIVAANSDNGGGDTIAGGAGDDTITITGFTGGNDSVDGGDDDDTITIDENSFGDGSTINGGSGGTDIDVLVFSDAVTITGDIEDAEHENIEIFRLSAAGNHIVLAAGEADEVTDSGTGDLEIQTGGTGNTITSLLVADGDVTIDGGLAATLGGGAASTFTVDDGSTITLLTGFDHDITAASGGEAGADAWSILEADLDGNDTLDGGDDGSDILTANESGGNGTTVADAAWANITNFEQITVGTTTGATTQNFTFGSNADTMIDSTANDQIILDLNGQEQTLFNLDTSDLSSANTVIVDDSSDNQADVTLINTENAANGGRVQIQDGTDGNIIGTTEDDTVIGGDGDDTMSGGDGDDSLVGGAGTDSMTGGNGNDDYIVNDLSEIKITDFKTAGADEVKFSDAVFDFNAAIPGVGFTASDITAVGADFAGGNFTATTNFIYDTTDGQVWYDSDANGVGDTGTLVVTIENFGSYSFVAGDFAAIA